MIAKCHVDECQTVPFPHGIRNILTLLFFKDGQLLDRVVGAAPKAEIAAKLDSLLWGCQAEHEDDEENTGTVCSGCFPDGRCRL